MFVEVLESVVVGGRRVPGEQRVECLGGASDLHIQGTDAQETGAVFDCRGTGGIVQCARTVAGVLYSVHTLWLGYCTVCTHCGWGIVQCAHTVAGVL